MTEQSVLIRPIREGEKEALKAIMNSAFPFLMRLFFSFSKNIIVAEKNGELVGGVILKMFVLPGQVKAGLVSLIFCSPQYSGLGIGQSLAGAGIDFLEKKGCSEIFACVEGSNTSSSHLFNSNGFTRLSLFQQFRVYGLNSLVIWFYSFHFFDIGFFMWAKSSKGGKRNAKPLTSSAMEWTFTVICHALIFVLSLWRQGDNNYLALDSIITLFACFTVFYAVRYGAMLSVSWFHTIKYEFRMWESGIILSSMIALLFGGFLVAPGSLYPSGDDWKHRKYISPFGVMALFSSLCLVGLVWGIGLLISYNLVPHYLLSNFETAFLIGTGLLVLDVLLPFFPFSSFNGRRLWDWNKTIWLLLSFSVIPLLVLF